MNKRPSGVSRRGDLEKELTAQIEGRQEVAEQGRETVATQINTRSAAAQQQFSIQQGVRRRHPERVLSQYAGISKETSNAESVWEKALMHEQARVEIPEEFKAQDAEMGVNQMGLVTTALDNYTRSKGKFARQFISGV